MLVVNRPDIAHDFLVRQVPGYVTNGQDPALLAVKNNVAIGAAAYQAYRPGPIYGQPRGASVEMTVAGLPKSPWLTPGNLAGFLWYPFRQLNVGRVTIYTTPTNERCIALVEGIGFVREGLLREAAANGDDLLVYGLLARDAERFLENSGKTKWVKHGQELPENAAAS